MCLVPQTKSTGVGGLCVPSLVFRRCPSSKPRRKKGSKEGVERGESQEGGRDEKEVDETRRRGEREGGD